jgi:hypothetical protein
VDGREDRSEGDKKAAEVLEAHQANVNQVRREPVPASHDDEHGRTPEAPGEEDEGAPAPDGAAEPGDDPG